MDPAQILASQKLDQHTSVPSESEIDAFYDDHGFESLLKVRHGWKRLRALFQAKDWKKPLSRPFALSQRKA